MSKALKIRHMTRQEADRLAGWTADEGWNPCYHDTELLWAMDPEAFIALDLNGELIGGATITAYERAFGFIGSVVVRPEHRGQGLGNNFCRTFRERLLKRLRPNATIGLDSAIKVQNQYARGGFVFSHRNLRLRADIPERPAIPWESEKRIVPLATVPFDRLLDYDRTCFPARRSAFLRRWITQPDALAIGFLRDGQLKGYAVARRCEQGRKVGPLFADDAQVAGALYDVLAGFAAGGPLFLDAPENNPAAMALVAKRKMTTIFDCARMYLGPAPVIAHERVFGVTTLDLG